MRYSYTVYRKNAADSGEPVTRLSVTTNFNEITIKDYQKPYYVEVYDNLTSKVVTVISDADMYDDWCEFLNRGVWLDASVKEDIKQRLDEMKTSIAAPYVVLPDNNLKTAAAAGKPKVSAVPPVALLALGAAMQNGADRYQRFNWREGRATSSVFYDAILRHLVAWYSGEDFAPDSKVHHLAHIMASCAILLDAEVHNVLNDDRIKTKTATKEDILKKLVDVFKAA